MRGINWTCHYQEIRVEFTFNFKYPLIKS